jgi:hypothetical protein
MQIPGKNYRGFFFVPGAMGLQYIKVADYCKRVVPNCATGLWLI